MELEFTALKNSPMLRAGVALWEFSTKVVGVYGSGCMISEDPFNMFIGLGFRV